jgi:hypothetical protein
MGPLSEKVGVPTLRAMNVDSLLQKAAMAIAEAKCPQHSSMPLYTSLILQLWRSGKESGFLNEKAPKRWL